ncbi:hypothetical protein Hanom_Chr09g00845431 [Helianthus anomalus]
MIRWLQKVITLKVRTIKHFNVKMPFLFMRYGHFCDFYPNVCFSASGSKRFEIMSFSFGSFFFFFFFFFFVLT